MGGDGPSFLLATARALTDAPGPCPGVARSGPDGPRHGTRRAFPWPGLSWWSLVGAIVYLPAAALAIAGHDELATISNVPLVLNEIALALWLIARGFEIARIPHGYAVPEARV